jgi:hypothetical protein
MEQWEWIIPRTGVRKVAPSRDIMLSHDYDTTVSSGWITERTKESV